MFFKNRKHVVGCSIVVTILSLCLLASNTTATDDPVEKGNTSAGFGGAGMWIQSFDSGDNVSLLDISGHEFTTTTSTSGQNYTVDWAFHFQRDPARDTSPTPPFEDN